MFFSFLVNWKKLHIFDFIIFDKFPMLWIPFVVQIEMISEHLHIW